MRAEPLVPAPPEAERRPWRIRDAVLALIAGLVTAMALFVIVNAVAGREPTDREVFGIVFMGQSLGTLAVLWRMSRSRGTGDIVADLRIRVSRGDLIGLPIGVGMQIGLGLMMGPIFELLDIDGPTQEVAEATQDATGALTVVAIFAAAALVAPITEEIVFRGVLLDALMRRFGENRAVLLSAGAFALIHLLDPGAYLLVPALFVVGIVLAALRMQRGTLGLAIMTHIGFNVVAVIGLLIPE